jgi:nucleolin
MGMSSRRAAAAEAEAEPAAGRLDQQGLQEQLQGERRRRRDGREAAESGGEGEGEHAVLGQTGHKRTASSNTANAARSAKKRSKRDEEDAESDLEQGSGDATQQPVARGALREAQSGDGDERPASSSSKAKKRAKRDAVAAESDLERGSGDAAQPAALGEHDEAEDGNGRGDEDELGGSEGELEVFTCYVEGIPYDTPEAGEQELWSLFASCGTLLDMRLPRWQDSNRLRGHAYFDFEEAAGMQAAIAKLNRHVFGSRYLTVAQAKSVQRGSAARKAAAGGAKDVPATCTTLFVKNLPYDIDEDTVQEAFAAFGAVKSVRLARWNHTGRLKGFGYVQFDAHDALKQCLASKAPIMVADRAVDVDADLSGGRPKASFKDAQGRQWNKTEGRALREEAARGRGARGGARGGASRGRGGPAGGPRGGFRGASRGAFRGRGRGRG